MAWNTPFGKWAEDPTEETTPPDTTESVTDAYKLEQENEARLVSEQFLRLNLHEKKTWHSTPKNNGEIALEVLEQMQEVKVNPDKIVLSKKILEKANGIVYNELTIVKKGNVTGNTYLNNKDGCPVFQVEGCWTQAAGLKVLMINGLPMGTSNILSIETLSDLSNQAPSITFVKVAGLSYNESEILGHTIYEVSETNAHGASRFLATVAVCNGADGDTVTCYLADVYISPIVKGLLITTLYRIVLGCRGQGPAPGMDIIPLEAQILQLPIAANYIDFAIEKLAIKKWPTAEFYVVLDFKLRIPLLIAEVTHRGKEVILRALDSVSYCTLFSANNASYKTASELHFNHTGYSTAFAVLDIGRAVDLNGKEFLNTELMNPECVGEDLVYSICASDGQHKPIADIECVLPERDQPPPHKPLVRVRVNSDDRNRICAITLAFKLIYQKYKAVLLSHVPIVNSINTLIQALNYYGPHGMQRSVPKQTVQFPLGWRHPLWAQDNSPKSIEGTGMWHLLNGMTDMKLTKIAYTPNHQGPCAADYLMLSFVDGTAALILQSVPYDVGNVQAFVVNTQYRLPIFHASNVNMASHRFSVFNSENQQMIGLYSDEEESMIDIYTNTILELHQHSAGTEDGNLIEFFEPLAITPGACMTYGFHPNSTPCINLAFEVSLDVHLKAMIISYCCIPSLHYSHISQTPVPAAAGLAEVLHSCLR